MDNINALVDMLKEKFPSQVSISDDHQSLVVSPAEIYAVLKEIKENTDYTFLADLTAVDFPERLEVVYHLMSLKDAGLVRIKAFLDKNNPKIDSVVFLWNAANVMERETYDLLGVTFEGHPDLKRILCPDDFEGHPLRKDFKVEPAVRQ
ncbi:MAG: NADH-quinone oxidoreductase subunit C [Bacillota bacterium]|jgi:NADH-quinone oxidoreductase subunit C|nr:NADH-quinone oxidoreductase subunit C [Clostridia bacterium]